MRRCGPQWAWVWALAWTLGGCGEVTIVDGSSASDAAPNDGGGDAAGGDATDADALSDTNASDAAGSDASSDVAADAIGDTATGTDAGADTGIAPGVTGQGQLVFESTPGPANFRQVALYMFQTSKPPLGQALVWWLERGDGTYQRAATLPYEDVPYVPDFTIKLPPQAKPAPEPLTQYFGAVVSLESELEAETLSAPKGPLAYKGDLAKAAWAHIVHTLVAKSPGQTGYLQDADTIVFNVDTHRSAAVAAFTKGDVAAARRQAEMAHNALVGKSSGKDLDGNGKVEFDAGVAMGLVAAETPVHLAYKHVVFAKDALGAAGGGKNFTDGFAAFAALVPDFDAAVADAITACAAFADGSVKDFKAADLAQQEVRKLLNATLSAGRKLATVDVVPVQ